MTALAPVRLSWIRASFYRFATFRFSLPRAHLVHNKTRNLFSTDTFKPLPREEMLTKFKSRIKDRPSMAGSTGEGFPEFLAEPRESFPHGVLITNPQQSSLAQLTAKCMEYVEENLIQHPAILFRNLPAQTEEDFSIIAREIPGKALTYEGGASFRQRMDTNIGTYISNNDPDEMSIDPHNELSYSSVYPSKVSYTNIQGSLSYLNNHLSSKCTTEIIIIKQQNKNNNYYKLVLSNNQRLRSTGENDRRSKRFCSNAVVCISCA